MFVAILLLAAIVMLFLYYRKRVATLKTVIAHVQYGVDPLSLNQGKYKKTVAQCSALYEKKLVRDVIKFKKIFLLICLPILDQ